MKECFIARKPHGSPRKGFTKLYVDLEQYQNYTKLLNRDTLTPYNSPGSSPTPPISQHLGCPWLLQKNNISKNTFPLFISTNLCKMKKPILQITSLDVPQN